MLSQDANQAQRMAAQRKRVFVSRGHIANAKHADQRFQFVGQRHHPADRFGWQPVARKTRAIVVRDGGCNLLTQPVVHGVIISHNALQLRELAHHVGQQISLGQACGQRRFFGQCIAAELLANGACDGADARHALALVAEFVVVDDLGQALHTRLQGLLAVLVIKELGIGQAGAHHALVTANNRAGVGRADVADHQEFVAQLARGVEQREVLLVGLHSQDQALLRHLQKFRLKAAGQHIRALHESGHLVQQRLVIHQLRAQSGCGRLQLARNVGTAHFKAGNHRTVACQGGGVVVSVGKHHRGHGRLKAVALGSIACPQAQCGDRHHGVAMQGHQAVRRAHKAHCAPAGQFAIALQLVAHYFGDGQFGDRLVQRFLQALDQRSAVHRALKKQGFGLAVHGALEAGHGRSVRAQSLQLFQQRRRGIASRVQAHSQRHEFLRHGFVGGLG